MTSEPSIMAVDARGLAVAAQGRTIDTRPGLAWRDLVGRRVGLYGLGVEGRASLRACRAIGVEPVVVEDYPSADSASVKITAPTGYADSHPEWNAPPTVLATDAGGLDALLACDVVIKSPGITRYGAAVRSLVGAGVAVVGGLGLWMAQADLSRVLIVTGTKGKSTTTAIAAHLLRGLGFRVMLGGNIGSPPFDPAVGDAFDYWVIEVSSYQATDLPVTPPVTIVTSLSPDHLPWHGGEVETYYRDKLSATTQPGAHVTVANGDSTLLRAHAALLGGEVSWVSLDDASVADDHDHDRDSDRDSGTRVGAGAATPADSIGTSATRTPPDGVANTADWTAGLRLLGAHNRRNAHLARAALVAMGVPGASDDSAIAVAAQGFSGLPHRLQIVGRRGGVDFVDDNLSTNVLPALAAVAAFPHRKVALLVGGQSRGIDYAPLAVGLAARETSYLVVTMPTNGRDIHAQVAAADSGGVVPVRDANSLADAVRIAADWAEPDGVVLLSPAAPSFDLFRDYRDRGEKFVDAIKSCGGIAAVAGG